MINGFNTLLSRLKAAQSALRGHVEPPMALKGTMEMVLHREDGSVEVFRKDNIIVSVGFGFVCDAIGNGASRPGVMDYIAVGTGTATPTSADTTLGTELNRQAATYTKVTNQQFTMAATFGPGVATGALTEAGVFNASSGGTMFDHVSFSVINKGANDTLTTTFTFSLS